MKKDKADIDKPYTGIRSLIREKGLSINRLHQEMKDQTNIDITLSAFYNFCGGWSFTRKPEMLNWVAGRLGVTSEALLGFYVTSGSTRAEKEAQKPKNKHKKEVKSKLSNRDNWI